MSKVRSPVLMTFAVSGAGKSYLRCARFLVDEWLPESDGVHCSNFPIKKAELLDLVCEKTGRPREDFESRIKIIDHETMADWATERSGPWEYFRGVDIEGWHIAIDEAHEVVGDKHSKNHKRKWTEFLAQLRHRGATVELISQHPDKVAREARNEAGIQLEIVKSEDRRDPFFRIPMGDWYELQASFSGKYVSSLFLFENRRFIRSWRVTSQRKYYFLPEYFTVYDSFSAPEVGGKKAQGPQHEYLKRSRASLFAWFARRNAFSLATRAALVWVVVWLTAFGGGVKMFKGGLAAITRATTARKVAEGKITPQEAAKLTAEGAEGVQRGTPTTADPIKTAVDLRRELNQTQEELKFVGDRNKALEAALLKVTNSMSQSYTLVAIQPGSATFRNGERYNEGEAVRMGPLVGRTLATIDFANRFIKLDDGRELRLGIPPAFDTEDFGLPKAILNPERPVANVPGTGGFVGGTPPVPGQVVAYIPKGGQPIPVAPAPSGRLTPFVPFPPSGSKPPPGATDVPKPLSGNEAAALRRAAIDVHRPAGNYVRAPDGVGFVPAATLPVIGRDGDSGTKPR